MSVKSLAHICIKTKDLQRTLDFYCGALGMEKVFDFTKNGDRIGCYLKASNNTFIEVFRAGETEPIRLRPASARQASESRTLSHFCFETDSIEELHQRLVEDGYAPQEIIMGADNALQFWIQEPNGLNIEFQQYTEHSSQFTGKSVEVS